MTKSRKGLFKVLAVAAALLLIIGLTSVICFAADDAPSSEGITKVSLSLDESITVKLRTNLSDYEGSKIVIIFEGQKYELTKNYGGVFTFTGVTPQNMNGTITAKMYSKDGAQIGDEVKFSVRSYLEALLGLSYEESGCTSELQYTAMKELAVNMLNYGAAAQIYTETDVDDLANKNLTDEQKALATAPITVNGTDKAVNGSAWVGAGVRFDYRLGLYFVFTADSLEGLTATINGRVAGGKAIPNVVYDAETEKTTAEGGLGGIRYR